MSNSDNAMGPHTIAEIALQDRDNIINILPDMLHIICNTWIQFHNRIESIHVNNSYMVHCTIVAHKSQGRIFFIRRVIKVFSNNRLFYSAREFLDNFLA